MWNAKAVSRHKLEVTQFLNESHIDTMLLVETYSPANKTFKKEATLSTARIIRMVNVCNKLLADQVYQVAVR